MKGWSMSDEIRVTVGGDTEPGTPARDRVATAGTLGPLGGRVL